MSSDPSNGTVAIATPPKPPTGQMFKQFRLEGLLGEGGMGQVYRAYDTRLHRPVAVKLLSSDLTADPIRKQRFVQEARAAARINHPSVAQIFDVDDQAGSTFIVMELVDGKTVQQLIQEKELDLLGCMDVAIQVAEGLAKAHQLGIVHRDIKPANVMRTTEGHVKILDFGLAKLLDAPTTAGAPGTQRVDTGGFHLTRTGIVMGTPAYMSPEQVRGLPVDLRADIFALGVMLFEMATGTSPFQRQNLMDALHAAAFEETPPMNSLRPQLPDELQQLVTRCLKKSPEDRYPNARLVAEELKKIRRNTEAGVLSRTSWRQRLNETLEELRHLPPSRKVTYALGAFALFFALYLSLPKVNPATFVVLGFAALFLYRYLRNRPQQLQSGLVRRISKIPEVRLITTRERHMTVVIEHPVAQLYGRLNTQLSNYNQRLYFGPPMTLTILHDVNADELGKMLSGQGVQYVNEELVKGGKLIPPGAAGTPPPLPGGTT